MGCLKNQTIPVNAFDPYLVRVQISDLDSNLGDYTLEDVIDLVFEVTKPDDTEVTFSPTIIETQTETLLVASYVLQDGDLDLCGGWSVLPVMNVGGPSPVYGTRRPFTVSAP